MLIIVLSVQSPASRRTGLNAGHCWAFGDLKTQSMETYLSVGAGGQLKVRTGSTWQDSVQFWYVWMFVLFSDSPRFGQIKMKTSDEGWEAADLTWRWFRLIARLHVIVNLLLLFKDEMMKTSCVAAAATCIPIMQITQNPHTLIQTREPVRLNVLKFATWISVAGSDLY